MQLGHLARGVATVARRAGKPTLEEAAIALQEEVHQRPFLRWCWINRTDPLTPGASSLPQAMVAWRAQGMPDGVDCCLSCGRPTWQVHVELEVVVAARGELKPTGNKLVYGHCTAVSCGASALIEVAPRLDVVG